MKNFITKVMYTETGHRLTDYEGKCAHLHGHSYRWEVTVYCRMQDLLENGMVMDFKDLKACMEDTIGVWDHAFLFHDDDPIISMLHSSHGEDYMLAALRGTDSNVPGGDRDADLRNLRVFWYNWNPTAENMVRYQFEKLVDVLAQERSSEKHDAYLKRIRVWETATSFAEYGGEG